MINGGFFCNMPESLTIFLNKDENSHIHIDSDHIFSHLQEHPILRQRLHLHSRFRIKPQLPGYRSILRCDR